MEAGRSGYLADALAVDQWAERITARSDFPRLVRRLIRQTNDQVVELDMRGGEGVDYSGYDGRVVASRGTPFVPAGLSVWELGVGSDPTDKANRDYKARTEDPRGVDKSQTTFVFATARRWPGKNDWAQRKRDEGEWFDVKAFDADDIETAFETAPAAHFWFCELIGLPVEGIQMVETWWEAFARLSNPNLTPELVLAGRADESARLLQFLEQDTAITTVSAASTDDVLSFVAATLLATPAPVQNELLARTLVVYDAATLRRLDAATDLLILLPFEDELRRAAQLVRSHHVILLAPRGTSADISLPAIDRDVFSEALQKEGVDERQATRLAQAAHRSLVAFQAETPSGTPPLRTWSKIFESRVARRAWLAGGWNEARSGDIDALSALLEMPFDDARAELRAAASGPDPVFATVGGTWGLTSDEEAWRYGSQYIDASDLRAVESLVQSVLAAVDPALGLPLKDRWAASLYGKERIHSSDLRKGLATTLAICGSFGGSVDVGGLGSAADWAASVVANVLSRANEDESGDLWASLADLLPLLAEAAPDVFLDAVQEGVRERSDALLRKMFLDEDGGFSVSSPHTGLLWALENLAWSPEHAPLAIKLLARLAEIDPGGKLSNRPLNSLVNIFRPWIPQTSLNSDRRLNVLDGLRRDHADVAWKLMLSLLPEYHGVGFYTHEPSFRSWKPPENGATNRERWDFEAAVAQRLLEDASADPLRWMDVVEHLDRFPHEQRPALANALRDLARSQIDAELRERIWNELDKTVRHHRSFAHAEWSLPSEQLDEIARVAENFAPEDPVKASTWLFDEHLPDMGVGRDEDYHQQEERVRQARTAAVEKVLETDGFGGLLKLSSKVEFPWFVGTAAAEHSTKELDTRIFALLDDPDQKIAGFAGGYAAKRVRAEGLEWLKGAVTDLETERQQARLLQASDDFPEAWHFISSLGPQVEEAYWEEFAPYGRGDFKFVNEAARSLLEHNRPIAALDLMSLYAGKEDRRVSKDLIVEGLERLTTLPEDHPEPVGRLSQYELETLLSYLRDVEFDEEKLGVLEWRLLPALGFDARTPVLERRLARDPKFFAEILSLVYRPRGVDTDEEEEIAPEVTRNAYRLLDEWQVVPGSPDRAADVDAEELRAWVEEARKLATEVGRSEVADLEIGKVFAHASTDADGKWPPAPIRDLIEQLASKQLEEGLHIQIRNNRGTTTRGLTDGGEQERALAAKYDDLAVQIRDRWPRTAAVLASVARSYEREARMHDEDAERFRQGMDR